MEEDPAARSAELKVVNGHTKFLPKRAKLGSGRGILPPLQVATGYPPGEGPSAAPANATGQGLSRTASAPQLTQPQYRQRGILSEVLRAHAPDEVVACRLGPAQRSLNESDGQLRKSASASMFKLSKSLRHLSTEARPKVPRSTVALVQPKVVEVQAHKPGDRPRKVTVERRKKWYESLNIEELLMQRGISFKHSNWNKHHWTNLDDFDNRDYDIRTPEEWIALGTNEAGEFLPLQAIALRMNEETNTGTWEACLCQGLAGSRFVVRWEDKTESQVSRLQILFYGENPETFADRLLFAIQTLRKAQSRAQLNFFIDNMPVDDIPCLGIDHVSRILKLVRSASGTKDAARDAAAAELVKEINLDWARTMNKICFLHDPQVLQYATDVQELPNSDVGKEKPTGLFASVNVCDLEEPGEDAFDRPAPWMALCPVPEYNFTQTFSQFCFTSLVIKPEVVTALGAITKECLWLMNTCQYIVHYDTAMRISQFKQLQKTRITTLAKEIRDGWVNRIIKIVQSNFKNVGKGWFNLQETNPDTYAEGKMKKLLHVIRFMMEDSLKYFVLDSVEDYCRSLELVAPDEVVVTSLLEVRGLFSPPQKHPPANQGGSLELLPPGRDLEQLEEGEQERTHLKPGSGVFQLEVKVTPDNLSFMYSAEPGEICSTVDNVVDLGLEALVSVPQVEASVVPQLFKTMVHKKLLNCPGARDSWIQARRETFRTAMAKALPCLSEFLGHLKVHEALIQLVPEDYVNAKAEAEITLEETKQLLTEHLGKEQAVIAAIPDSITVGFCEVNCLEVKKTLAGKHKKVVDLLLDYLQGRFRDSAESICASFTGMFSTLKKAPKDIEGITELRDYIGTVPSEVAKLMPEIKRALDTFHALEDFGIRVTADDFHQRWRVFGSPKDASDLVEATLASLSEAENDFLNAQKEEQIEFDDSLIDLAQTIETFGRYDNLEALEEIYENAESVNERLKEAAAKAKVFNSRETLFGKETTDYSQVQLLAKEWEPFSQLWVTAHTWLRDSKDWMSGPFGKIDAKACEAWVMASTKTLFKAVKAFEKREGVDKVLEICRDIKTQVDEFAPKVPIIVGLRNHGMRDRHWEQVTELVGAEVNPEMEEFTLDKFLELGMLDHANAIADIGDRSGKELSIETQLHAMQAAWKKVAFDCSEPYRNTETYILKGADEVIALLDEQIVTTQAMQFSPFNKPFKEEIDEWNDKLVYVSECLDQWLKVQRAWMYLQPIFDSPDIMKQLPTEGKKFKSVDKKWRQAMSRVNKDGHALSRCTEEGLLQLWQVANADLDAVQKGLDDYLETKRGAFARFYFLSNDELLEILSQTKDPLRVQPFLSKVFEAMKQLTFTDALVATQMHSKEGEIIDFVTPVSTNGKNVEVWMTEVEDQMLASVRNVIRIGVETYAETERTDWVQQHPGQVVLNSSQVHWTAEVEDAIGNAALSDYHAKLKEQLLGLVRLVRGDVTKLQRMSIGALVVIDVHAMDTVEKMAQENITDPMSFEWISQLRYYWEIDDRNTENLDVRMVQTPFPYGYEYLGNSFRLVITPLTDMCYMTLMGAQSLNLGGAPAGPAGTGKTETTKDLAKALAKQCVVFNCSPEMDYLMVGKFFKGLASSGAWCCFDEFNRINIEVLSVIAQQLLQLFGAKRQLNSYNETFELEFDGTMISMKPTFNVFITMNPGYAGRSELPDNLAALFRPMAMMVPDYGLIGEISFYAFGFEEGRHLAKKMVTTFQLCSEQLSAQSHYDYGMRAVKTVIEAAGLNKRKYPQQSEGQILLRALRDVNVPKFLRDDLPLFDNIISDLFPGVEKPQMDYGSLKEACEDKCHEFHLQPTDYFIKKQFELFDMIQVRHGMMLVGPTGGGKTECYRTLQAACTSLLDPAQPESPYQRVHVHVLNPKAITQNQLYGSFDEITREWSDGVAAELIRNAVRDNINPDHHWVMFDGPVDALWIESMNTVLDDNKKLCLVSGEIIALTSKMRMQFEVEDLEVASPATVSRCGMIYMEPESLGYDVFFESWIEVLPETFKMKPDYAVTLLRLCREIVPPTLTFVRKATTEVVATQDNNLIQSLFRLLDCYFLAFKPNELKPVASFKEAIADLKSSLIPLFFFCLVWSIGASCDGKSRPKFSRYLWAMISKPHYEEMAVEMEKAFIPMPTFQEDVVFNGLEPGCDIYDYFYSQEEKAWIPWMDTIPAFEVPRGAKYEEIVVPSIDSVRLVYIFQLLVLNDQHVLCPGPTGTGKSVNIALWLQKTAPEHIQATFINFSAQTHVNQLQDLIDSKLEKRRRGVFGPPAGKKMVLFIDDLNMPLKEYYGAQPPVELIRQWHDHKGWFNRKELVKFNIIDIVMVSAMGPPGGGRTFITPRLKRHYSNTAYSDLSEASIRQIFNTISGYFFVTFDEKVQGLIPSLMTSTLNVFNRALEDLLPTPSKSHYLFNLRDIWKVFLGICSLTPKKANDPLTVTRCWAHEIQRIFGDRLTDQGDLTWMRTQLDTNIAEIFGLKSDDVFANERLIFGSFMEEPDNRAYEEIADMKAMKEKIEEYLEDYNNVNTITMPLVMFLDACEHCSRICRVLAQPSGHVLLLGVGGSGRQSLTRLSCYISESDCFQIEVAKGYGMTEFKDDVKKCLMKCGVEDKVQIFLFCDTQIVKEDFVEAINNILNSGDVPNLYANEDFESISSSCRQLCQAMGMQPTKANLFSAYLSRVKKNVHVTLAFSPVGDSFRNRLRMFPSLVNCCTIDWFHEWPAEALYSVAKQQLTGSDVKLPNLEGSLTLFQSIHQGVEGASQRFLKATGRHVYVTPTSYLELLNSFMQILADKRLQVNTQQTRYSVGLTKIQSAEEAVAGLQQQLVEKKPALEQTQKEVGEMMVVIQKDKAAAEEVSTAVAAEEAVASQKADEVQVVKDDAQRDLDEALPALDEAVQCLKKLKKDHISEIKALGNPPSGVRLATEACCIMFGMKPVKKADPNNAGKKFDDYWETSQKVLLADPKKLLDDLFEFDKDNIPEARINIITGYMEREDFDPAAIKKASIACEAICMWTRAMYKYHFIAKAVEPKRAMLRKAEEELGECQAKLDEAQSKLRQVQDKIAKLEEDFNQAVAKQTELQDDMNLCEVKLERAHKLIGGLGGEKARWGQNVLDLKAQAELLPGDCIVAAGMVSYVGPFTAGVRLECEESWRRQLAENGIEHNEGCSMRSVLGDPVKIQQWVVCSLPNDALSIENGIIIDRSRRWPLMIDPQRQANKYIKNMGKDSFAGIDICKLSEKNFLRTLELGIQFGKWILLENIGITLDPALEPVLLQQKVKDGSGFIIKLGDKSVTYSDTFKFFMTTTLPNPHYSPETSVKVTLLNFAITPTGLEDQMLGIVVAKERPDLEDQKNELVVQNAKMNKDLKEIEDDILKLLATSEGDVLEDDTLVNKVTSSKEVSDDINQKKISARSTEENIDIARESYRPVAYRTAVLFFCIVELTNIDPMYQYSLQWFQKLFTIAIDQSPKNDDFAQRLEILKDFFTESLYQNICRGLFEKDKTLFSFALCTRILKGDNKLDDGQLRYLLIGPTSDMVEHGPELPAEWIGKPRWNEILTLATLPAFHGFVESFTSNISAYKAIYDSVEADKEPMPEPWESKLSSLEKLCFMRALRMDCLGSAVITFISEKIGQKFVEPPTFDIAKSFGDSLNTTPLIFILSPGTDPVADVIAYAEKVGMHKRFESISLGQGQGEKATKLIVNAQQTGGWVLLSNCHLMESWMSSLEALVEQLNPETMSPAFRLWLTSMPAKSFPVQVLQNGVKMTNEPPSGLRANMLRSYSTISDDLFKQSEKPDVFKPLLFGFCFFHAIVQDRRKFGPIGWNIAYGFTPEDLQVCKEQLMLFINQYNEVPYKVLNFLGAKINYGGRVTDDKDKLLISTILKTFITPEAVEQRGLYRYSASGLYYPPEAESVQEFIDFIKGFPLYPMPEAFGLHENCNITCAQDEALRMLSGMQHMVQLGGGGEDGQSADDVMDDVAAGIQDRLPKPFPLDVCETKFPTLYEESMNTVVKQECLRYNNLLWCMAASLRDFRKAIKGLIVMTGELESLGKSLFVNEQPEMWVKKGPLSLKPLSSWYLDILNRCEFFQEWFDLGKAPPVFWISGIFFPQAFFTGAMQNFARKYNEEIDLLSFKHTMRDDITDPKAQLTEPPADGVYIYGIFMEGCRWDSKLHKLADSRPKELFTELPSLWFCPVKNREPDMADYRCPCYKVVSRKGTLLTTGHSTNFVLYIELKTDCIVDKWIKAGVASFLALKF